MILRALFLSLSLCVPAFAADLEIIVDRRENGIELFLSMPAEKATGVLGVELAQLEYSLPRLKRMWTHLSRIKMGVGMRGPGEKQLEVRVQPGRWRAAITKYIFDM